MTRRVGVIGLGGLAVDQAQGDRVGGLQRIEQQVQS